MCSEGMSFDEAVEVGPLKCRGCGREVWPRVGGYWFLLLSPRGRCRFPGVEELRAVLCSPCGRRVREAIESTGVGLEGCFERVIQREGEGTLGGRDEEAAEPRGGAFDRGVVRD